jgi:hypothetical protein
MNRITKATQDAAPAGSVAKRTLLPTLSGQQWSSLSCFVACASSIRACVAPELEFVPAENRDWCKMARFESAGTGEVQSTRA